jgi:hypothetical protein
MLLEECSLPLDITRLSKPIRMDEWRLEFMLDYKIQQQPQQLH